MKPPGAPVAWLLDVCMNVLTVPALAAKPEVFSYTRLISSRKTPARSRSKLVNSAKAWCHSRGLELASDAHHADLRHEGLTSVERLALLHVGLDSGQISCGNVLVVEGLDSLSLVELERVGMALLELMLKGLRVVMLTDPGRVWKTNSVLDVASFMVGLAALYREEEARARRSARAREAYRKEVK